MFLNRLLALSLVAHIRIRRRQALLAQDVGVPGVAHLVRDRDVLVVVGQLVQDRLRQALTTEDVGLEPPWQVLSDLVTHVGARRDGEDVVELLERALLGLGQPEEAR